MSVHVFTVSTKQLVSREKKSHVVEVMSISSRRPVDEKKKPIDDEHDNDSHNDENGDVKTVFFLFRLLHFCITEWT